jgi:1-deoxy-D-xylulose 5-phosphate reductoisomerase
VAIYNYVKIEQNLERVVNENSLIYATVVFFDGEVVSYKEQEEMKSVLSGPLHQRAQEINDTLVQYEKIQGEEFCDIAVPIFLKGKNWHGSEIQDLG